MLVFDLPGSQLLVLAGMVRLPLLVEADRFEIDAGAHATGVLLVEMPALAHEGVYFVDDVGVAAFAALLSLEQPGLEVGGLISRLRRGQYRPSVHAGIKDTLVAYFKTTLPVMVSLLNVGLHTSPFGSIRLLLKWETEPVCAAHQGESGRDLRPLLVD